MGTLLEDLQKQSDWIVKAFAADKITLDYSIHSFIEVDRFFNRHSRDGKAIKGGRLSQNLGLIIFGLGSYVGQTFMKNIPGCIWQTDDKDPQGEINASIQFPDGTIIFPMQKLMKRFQNGFEDAVYVYGHHLAKGYIDEPFDQSFWNVNSELTTSEKKPWWKFW